MVAFLVELTVCNFVDAAKRKTDKYQDLVEMCISDGFCTNLITLEVGSRGFLNIHGFRQLLDKFSLSNQGKIEILRLVGSLGFT